MCVCVDLEDTRKKEEYKRSGSGMKREGDDYIHRGELGKEVESTLEGHPQLLERPSSMRACDSSC